MSARSSPEGVDVRTVGWPSSVVIAAVLGSGELLPQWESGVDAPWWCIGQCASGPCTHVHWTAFAAWEPAQIDNDVTVIVTNW